MGLKQLPPVAYMKKMFKLLSHHYPMRLGHVLFTNVGPSVMLCWKVVSPLLQARTKAKMHLIPSTWVYITKYFSKIFRILFRRFSTKYSAGPI